MGALFGWWFVLDFLSQTVLRKQGATKFVINIFVIFGAGNIKAEASTDHIEAVAVISKAIDRERKIATPVDGVCGKVGGGEGGVH